jgi:hypothetical protein
MIILYPEDLDCWFDHEVDKKNPKLEDFCVAPAIHLSPKDIVLYKYEDKTIVLKGPEDEHINSLRNRTHSNEALKDLPSFNLRIQKVLSLLCEEEPSIGLIDDWLINESEEIISWILSKCKLNWAQGIEIIEAAQSIAESPQEQLTTR